MKTGIELIAEERRRQIEAEGWTAEHDKGENSNGQLAAAAASYAFTPFMKDEIRKGYKVPLLPCGQSFGLLNGGNPPLMTVSGNCRKRER